MGGQMRHVFELFVTVAILLLIHNNWKKTQERVFKDAIDPNQLTERETLLSTKAPKGAQLAAYIHCGSQRESTDRYPARISLLGGDFHQWPPVEKVTVLQRTVCYSGAALQFRISGLDRSKRYRAGVTWWDYDDPHGRISSITALSSDGAKSVVAISEAQLPNYSRDHKLPVEKEFPLDPSLYQDGKLQVKIAKVEGLHTAVSDFWIWAL